MLQGADVKVPSKIRLAFDIQLVGPSSAGPNCSFISIHVATPPRKALQKIYAISKPQRHLRTLVSTSAARIRSPPRGQYHYFFSLLVWVMD